MTDIHKQTNIADTIDANKVLHAQRASGSYQAVEDTLAPDVASVGFRHPGGYLFYRNVDFGDGKNTTFMAVLSADQEATGKNLEIRLDSPSGILIGSLSLSGGDETIFTEQYTSLMQTVTGVHDVYLVSPNAEIGRAHV